MKHFRFKLLTLGIVILFLISIIILGEFTLRSIGLGDPLIHESNKVWRYSLAPNQHKKRFKNNIVKINNAGLRANKEWTKKNDEKLVLFIGDSVTYGGSSTDNSELFSEKVCDHLGKNFICGNAGTNYYSILNMVLRSRYDKRISNADIVIFTIISDNFLRGLSDIRILHYFTSPANKYLPATEEALNWFSWRYDINHYLKRIPPRRKSKMENFYSNNERQVFDAAEFALKNFNEEIIRLKNEKKEVFIFFSPSKKDVENEETEELKKLKKLVLDKTINIYDMTKEFKKNKEKKIYIDAIHYDAYGNELVSEIIYKQILKN
tara:strand:- start:2246 stop:3208 length:963 start_codon:yes stop_codon:yes gene_type:complete